MVKVHINNTEHITIANMYMYIPPRDSIQQTICYHFIYPYIVVPSHPYTTDNLLSFYILYSCTLSSLYSRQFVIILYIIQLYPLIPIQQTICYHFIYCIVVPSHPYIADHLLSFYILYPIQQTICYHFIQLYPLIPIQQTICYHFIYCCTLSSLYSRQFVIPSHPYIADNLLSFYILYSCTLSSLYSRQFVIILYSCTLSSLYSRQFVIILYSCTLSSLYSRQFVIILYIIQLYPLIPIQQTICYHFIYYIVVYPLIPIQQTICYHFIYYIVVPSHPYIADNLLSFYILYSCTLSSLYSRQFVIILYIIQLYPLIPIQQTICYHFIYYIVVPSHPYIADNLLSFYILYSCTLSSLFVIILYIIQLYPLIPIQRPFVIILYIIQLYPLIPIQQTICYHFIYYIVVPSHPYIADNLLSFYILYSCTLSSLYSRQFVIILYIIQLYPLIPIQQTICYHFIYYIVVPSHPYIADNLLSFYILYSCTLSSLYSRQFVIILYIIQLYPLIPIQQTICYHFIYYIVVPSHPYIADNLLSFYIFYILLYPLIPIQQTICYHFIYYIVVPSHPYIADNLLSFYIFYSCTLSSLYSRQFVIILYIVQLYPLIPIQQTICYHFIQLYPLIPIHLLSFYIVVPSHPYIADNLLSFYILYSCTLSSLYSRQFVIILYIVQLYPLIPIQQTICYHFIYYIVVPSHPYIADNLLSFYILYSCTLSSLYSRQFVIILYIVQLYPLIPIQQTICYHFIQLYPLIPIQQTICYHFIYYIVVPSHPYITDNLLSFYIVVPSHPYIADNLLSFYILYSCTLSSLYSRQFVIILYIIQLYPLIPIQQTICYHFIYYIVVPSHPYIADNLLSFYIVVPSHPYIADNLLSFYILYSCTLSSLYSRQFVIILYIIQLYPLIPIQQTICYHFIYYIVVPSHPYIADNLLSFYILYSCTLSSLYSRQFVIILYIIQLYPLIPIQQTICYHFIYYIVVPSHPYIADNLLSFYIVCCTLSSLYSRQFVIILYIIQLYPLIPIQQTICYHFIYYIVVPSHPYIADNLLSFYIVYSCTLSSLYSLLSFYILYSCTLSSLYSRQFVIILYIIQLYPLIPIQQTICYHFIYYIVVPSHPYIADNLLSFYILYSCTLSSLYSRQFVIILYIVQLYPLIPIQQTICYHFIYCIVVPSHPYTTDNLLSFYILYSCTLSSLYSRQFVIILYIYIVVPSHPYTTDNLLSFYIVVPSHPYIADNLLSFYILYSCTLSSLYSRQFVIILYIIQLYPLIPIQQTICYHFIYYIVVPSHPYIADNLLSFYILSLQFVIILYIIQLYPLIPIQQTICYHFIYYIVVPSHPYIADNLLSFYIVVPSHPYIADNLLSFYILYSCTLSSLYSRQFVIILYIIQLYPLIPIQQTICYHFIQLYPLIPIQQTICYHFIYYPYIADHCYHFIYCIVVPSHPYIADNLLSFYILYSCTLSSLYSRQFVIILYIIQLYPLIPIQQTICYHFIYYIVVPSHPYTTDNLLSFYILQCTLSSLYNRQFVIILYSCTLSSLYSRQFVIILYIIQLYPLIPIQQTICYHFIYYIVVPSHPYTTDNLLSFYIFYSCTLSSL